MGRIRIGRSWQDLLRDTVPTQEEFPVRDKEYVSFDEEVIYQSEDNDYQGVCNDGNIT